MNQTDQLTAAAGEIVEPLKVDPMVKELIKKSISTNPALLDMANELEELKNDACEDCGTSTWIENGDSVKDLCGYCKIKRERDQLQTKCTELQDRMRELEQSFNSIINCVPEMHEGSLIVEHFDGDGNYNGSENVDPLSVIQQMDSIAREALTTQQPNHEP